MRFKTSLLTAMTAVGLIATASAAVAADKTVTIGYQTVVEPSKVAQADGLYEKATGWKINWRKFDSGADVIAALASGDVQIGYVGSSPLAAAASRELPIETIVIASEIGSAEALVVRKDASIAKPGDLAGKKIAVPFVSTAHYSLLAAFKHWGIDPKSTQILNLRPPEIIAAWARGDIDATYVWDPALGKAKENGTILATSADVAKWGAPTFDAWIARKDFSAANPDVVKSFVQITTDSFADYRKNAASWTPTSTAVQKIVKLTGAKAEEVPDLLTGSHFPTADEQASPALLGGGTVQALTATAAFLKEQGKIDRVLPDYAPYVQSVYVKQAIAAK